MKIETNYMCSDISTIRTLNIIPNYCVVRSIDELSYIISYANEKNYKILIIGNGSNTLVGQLPIHTIVVRIALSNILVENNVITAEAGVMLPALSKFCLEHSLSGFEWANRIPGTVGGAVAMNAGAFGSEMFDLIEDVTVISKSGELSIISKEDIDYGYRWTNFLDTESIIVKASLKLECDHKEKIESKMVEFAQKRERTQPQGFSLGSTFKAYIDKETNQKKSAGYIIDQCGLKGKEINNVLISDKHANFLINKNNASADDILYVINYIEKVVYEKTGIELEREIRLFFDHYYNMNI